jgi:two-component system phosphate regulon sensor histidine kinase PhoR
MSSFLVGASAAIALVFYFLWRREIFVRRRREEILLAEKSRAITHLEDELRVQESARREMEEVFASLQDAVFLVDGEARLRFLNHAALQMFEVRVEDVLGAQLLEAFPSFGLEAAVRAALEQAKNSAQEITLHAPQLREVLMRVAPVRRQTPLQTGQSAGAVVILQDLTELRRLERMRRDFVANASHELRTPIANMRAMAETLQEAPDDKDLAARFYPQMISEAERLSRLVSDLLDLARLESQAEEDAPPLQSLDLVPLIYDVVHRSKYKAIERHIEVVCEFAPGCERDVFVAGEAATLEQVVFNLLDNALMYTPAQGKVTLSLSREKIDAGEADKSRVLLRVRDTGIGIPAGDLQRIFERFYRVDKARARAQGGTGLGLAIVKHIVENQGGHVWAQSEQGQGTTFFVALAAA